MSHWAALYRRDENLREPVDELFLEDVDEPLEDEFFDEMSQMLDELFLERRGSRRG